MATKVKSMDELFVNGLKDVYDAERRMTKALPKMSKAANSAELTSAFNEHLGQTQTHISRLDEVFLELDQSPGRKTCDAMVGLITEGDHMLEEAPEGPLRDASLIAAAQKVEHYEIATYGALRDWAQQLGHDSIAQLLQQTLDEEGETDKRLTEIARSINHSAANGGAVGG